jgi:hypothetical protein
VKSPPGSCSRVSCSQIIRVLLAHLTVSPGRATTGTTRAHRRSPARRKWLLPSWRLAIEVSDPAVSTRQLPPEMGTGGGQLALVQEIPQHGQRDGR